MANEQLSLVVLMSLLAYLNNGVYVVENPLSSLLPKHDFMRALIDVTQGTNCTTWHGSCSGLRRG